MKLLIIIFLFINCLLYAQDSLYTSTPELKKTSIEYLQNAISHYDGNRFNQCLKSLNDALEVNKNGELSDILYYYKALTLINLKKDSLALTQLDTALYFNNSKAHYFLLRAELCMRMGYLEAAEKDIDKTIEIDPENEAALVNKGILFQQKGMTTEAAFYYNKALRNNNNNKEALYMRGLLYLQNGLALKGCEDLKKSAELGHKRAIKDKERYCN